MRFVWDEEKNRRNRRKHGVSFETAQLVFDDPNALSVMARIVEGEERWQTMGLVGAVVVLIVAHTFQERDGEEGVRIISARKATPRERRHYEQSV
jgi:uncharacterized protein